MEYDNSMSERILRSLESIINRDTHLKKDFTIVPTTEHNTQNKSPVLYEAPSIGLESWCTGHIYRYAYAQLLDVRALLALGKLPPSRLHNLNRLLIGALLLNPDVYTLWNMKRELVLADTLSIESELSFARVVITFKCKSNETFAYRKWLLRRLLNKYAGGDVVAYEERVLDLLRNELEVCEMAASKAPNNYHAWTHRIWCMDNLIVGDGGNPEVFLDLILSELDFSYSWISRHVSEHSGYHYRQYLIELVMKSSRGKNLTIFERYYQFVIEHLQLVNENDPRNILLFLLGKQKYYGTIIEESNKFVNYFALLLYDLFHTVNDLNTLYPNHEALWCYRRYLLYHLILASYEYHNVSINMGIVIDCDRVRDGSSRDEINLIDLDSFGSSRVNNNSENGEKQAKLFKSKPDLVKLTFLYRVLVKNETKFINDNTNSSELAKRYEKWLKFIFSFDEV